MTAGRIFSALLIVAAVVISAGVWRSHARPTDSGYAVVRKGVLIDQATTAPKGGVLLIGDSLTERAPVTKLCGLPVFNAGISGAGVNDLLGFAAHLARELKPQLTIIAIGVNDAERAKGRTNLAMTFRQVDQEVGGASYVLPLMPDKVGQFGTTYFDPVRVAQVRAAILSLHRPTVRPFDVAGHTIDGVHLDPAAKAVWRRRLETLCS